jgi:hypothetical protein
MTMDALLAACKAEFPALDWAPVHGDVDDDRPTLAAVLPGDVGTVLVSRSARGDRFEAMIVRDCGTVTQTDDGPVSAVAVGRHDLGRWGRPCETIVAAVAMWTAECAMDVAESVARTAVLSRLAVAARSLCAGRGGADADR